MAKQQPGTTEKIIAAAEKRMRDGGFHGFSFREIAADVGIKSASVHHHFPTKEHLGAAVANSYAERFMAALGDPEDPNRKPSELLVLYVDLFRRALIKERLMCLCGVLASEVKSLPDEVAQASHEFFQRNLEWLEVVLRRKSPRKKTENHRADALRILASLEGAMLVAKGLRNDKAFEVVAESIAK